jgi:hypothetical protein
VVDASCFQKTVVLYASLINSTSLPTRLRRSSVRHVRTPHKYYLYGRISVPRRVSKSILLALNQYRALRSGHGERLHPASPTNNTQDGGEEPGEGDDAAESREGGADEIKDEDGHCGEEGGEGRA